jgi:hypothetical protein
MAGRYGLRPRHGWQARERQFPLEPLPCPAIVLRMPNATVSHSQAPEAVSPAGRRDLDHHQATLRGYRTTIRHTVDVEPNSGAFVEPPPSWCWSSWKSNLLRATLRKPPPIEHGIFGTAGTVRRSLRPCRCVPPKRRAQVEPRGGREPGAARRKAAACRMMIRGFVPVACARGA